MTGPRSSWVNTNLGKLSRSAAIISFCAAALYRVFGVICGSALVCRDPNKLVSCHYQYANGAGSRAPQSQRSLAGS